MAYAYMALNRKTEVLLEALPISWGRLGNATSSLKLCNAHMCNLSALFCANHELLCMYYNP